jgi:hypothetical protein
MMIGDIKVGSDECPSCQRNMIRKPLGKRIREGSVGFSLYCASCPSCGYDGPEYKVSNDYLFNLKRKKSVESSDITPYKYGIFGKIFRVFK